MSFEINIEGLRTVSRRVEHVVEAAAIMARDEVVAQMEPGPARTGREYPIPGTGRTYIASAEGQPPAVREGRYVASITNTPAVRDGDVVRARAYTALKVGGASAEREIASALGLANGGGEYVLGDLLENGTIKMAPRPHWRPAFELVQPKIAELVQRASSA